jgi:hypothetical protein
MERKSIKHLLCSSIGWILLLSVLQSVLGSGTNTRQGSSCSPPTVTYCDLVKNPERYDGKEVIVRAAYRYGFEWQEMFCLECREIGKTWLELDDDITPTSKAALRKAPKNEGTINAVFSGTFHSSKGPYGDGGYRFKFVVKTISQVEVVYKDGRVPDELPLDAQKKLCATATSREQ